MNSIYKAIINVGSFGWCTILVTFLDGVMVAGLVPDLEERIPGAGTNGHAVLGHTQARDAVVMARQNTCSLLSHRVPHVAVEVVVAGEQEAARFRERDRGNATNDVVVRVHSEFLIGTDVEKSAGGVVRACCKRISRREERNGVDIRLVAGERLLAHSIPDIPEFSGCIAGTRDECAHVRRQGQ